MGSAVPAQRNELPPKDLAPPVYWLTKRLSDDYGGLPLSDERSTSANPYAAALPGITTRHSAQNFWFQRGCWSILADAGLTGGSYSVFEVELPRGVAGHPHIHDQSHIAFYILAGEIKFFVDDKVLEAKKGTLVFVPRGSVHVYEVESETARFLNIHTQPGYERIIRALGTRVHEAGLPHAGWEQRVEFPERLVELYSEIGPRPVAFPKTP